MATIPILPADYKWIRTDDEIKFLAEVDRLRNLLFDAGICADCGEIIIHDIDEPFAYCNCGTSECHEVPLLSQVRTERIEQLWKEKQNKSSSSSSP